MWQISTKDISNQSEVNDVPTILESILAGRKTEIEKLYKDIGALSKLILAQFNSNLINKTFIAELKH